MRIALCIILSFILCIQGEAQYFEPFVNNLKVHNKNTPQERVYLEHDRYEGCTIGDTIHFTAKVVRMDSLCVSDKSGILYVDLIGPRTEIIDTRKLCLDSLGMVSGAIVVDTLLRTGFYQIRAYTRYQRNWPKNRVFSKVIPVYYPDSLISVKERRKNKGAGFLSLGGFDNILKNESKDIHVMVYREGGSFFPGKPIRVAIHCFNGGGVPVSGTVRIEDKEWIYSKVSAELDRFGNAVFEIVPTRSQTIIVKERHGKHKYAMPRIKSSGLNLRVDAIGGDSVRIWTSCESDLLGQRFCTIIMNRGNLLYSDSSIVTKPFNGFKIAKSSLGRGVHDVVVFSENGVQMARRRFFLGKIESDEEQWTLLESELSERNMLPRGAYKTLTDEEIDRMLMVDDTRSYPWDEMASQGFHYMSQPMEKKLMVFGRVVPSAKKPTESDAHLDGRKFKLTLSQGETIYKSDIVCDSKGYFGSYFPDLRGEWMLMAHHSKELPRHKVLIIDNISPYARKLVVGDVLPELFGKSRWVSPNVKEYATRFYNCDEYTKDRMNNGLISQSFYTWLGMNNSNMNKMKGAVSPIIVNILPDSTFNKHLDYNFFGTSSDDPRTVAVDGPTYNRRPIVWIIDGQYRMVTGLQKKITDFKVLRPCHRHMPNFVDEVKSVIISEDPTAFYPYMRCSVLESKKPVTIFITLHKNYIWNDSGLITAPFQGVE